MRVTPNPDAPTIEVDWERTQSRPLQEQADALLMLYSPNEVFSAVGFSEALGVRGAMKYLQNARARGIVERWGKNWRRKP